MTRLKDRPDYFQYRGNRFFFHRLQDGPTLARLDPYAEGEQSWLLNSGRTIDVTAAEIRQITLEVHGIELPAVNPDLKFITDPTLEPRIAALEKLVAEMAERISAQAAVPDPELVAVVEPAPAEPDPIIPDTGELDALRARLAKLEAENARLKEPTPAPETPAWVDTAAEQEVKTDDLLDLMRTDPASAEDVVQKFSKVGRKKFTELLNVELAELQQERGGPREDLKRENEIEALLGLFARVGEM